MTSAIRPVLDAVRDALRTALAPVPVYVGAAPDGTPEPHVAPYVVLVQPQETESLFPATKDRAHAATDTLATLRVWGGFAQCETVAAAVTAHLLTSGLGIEAEGRRLLSARLAQNVPIPAGGPTDTPVYGRQVAVRLTTAPLN